ncbi:MAG: formate hydrogenlyase subunit 6/NADH:ubiquinone oxidoreductase subunit I [Candidatus Latescibacterota bacterium]|jgi:formate hydrogenlyase subunit 6/NADH:ubiquinone oxidoreductase subunit I
MAFVKEILDGTKTLLTGMKVTLDNFRKPPITSKYPIEKLEMSQAFRNVIVLIEKDDIQTHDCIGCKACERVCPSFCIVVDGERPEDMRRMRATNFKVDFALCSDCGLCLDVCPTDTLGYSKVHDEAGYNRSDFVYDLLDPWREAEAPTVERLRKLEAEQAAAKKARTVKKAAVKKAAADTPVNTDDTEKNDA